MRSTKILIDVPVYPNHKTPSRLVEESKLLELFEKFVKEDPLVVDFGCGTSYYTGEKGVVGLDLDLNLLSRAEVEHKIRADFRHSPLRENLVDGIVMCHSLEHSNLPEVTLREVHRILKKGGVIVSSVPNISGFKSMYYLVFKQKLIVLGADHLTAFTPKIFYKCFEDTGFTVKEMSGDIVYFPFMKKLGLMKLGYWLGTWIPGLANVIMVAGVKN